MKHGCGYCSTVRSRIAYEKGLTEEKLMATMDFEKSPLFDDRERAALRFATLFKSSDDGIDSDDVYSDLKKHFSDEEIIELGVAVRGNRRRRQVRAFAADADMGGSLFHTATLKNCTL